MGRHVERADAAVVAQLAREEVDVLRQTLRFADQIGLDPPRDPPQIARRHRARRWPGWRSRQCARWPRKQSTERTHRTFWAFIPRYAVFRSDRRRESGRANDIKSTPLQCCKLALISLPSPLQSAANRTSRCVIIEVADRAKAASTPSTVLRQRLVRHHELPQCKPGKAPHVRAAAGGALRRKCCRRGPGGFRPRCCADSRAALHPLPSASHQEGGPVAWLPRPIWKRTIFCRPASPTKAICWKW